MTMEELRLVVASKLIKLRQNAGMTQAELGEKLNYSDKTVSKWERGESIPDAFVLKRLAEIYDTTVDALLSEEEPWMDPVKKQRQEERAQAPQFSSTVVTLVAIMGIWTMAVLMFVIFWLAADRLEWLIFAAAIPISLVTLLVLNSVWNRGRGNLLIVMVLVGCIAALVYLALPSHPWQLFLILIPAEIVTWLSFNIKGLKLRKSPETDDLSDS